MTNNRVTDTNIVRIVRIIHEMNIVAVTVVVYISGDICLIVTKINGSGWAIVRWEMSPYIW